MVSRIESLEYFPDTEETYETLEAVDREIERIVNSLEPPVISSAAKDICKGGKRLRPALVLLSCKAVSGGISDEAIRFAAGVELVHISSLIADDIIDRSELRRGSPSVHNSYGHEVAVLTSNILLSKALEVIDKKRASLSMVRALKSLGEGEAMEILDNVKSLEDYLDLAFNKTASLFIASCEIGSIVGGGNKKEIQALSSYGKNIGIGFQIRDDILDLVSTEEKLGKPVEKDSNLERPSIVSFIDTETAQNKALSKIKKAKDSLRVLDESKEVSLLKNLADFSVERKK